MQSILTNEAVVNVLIWAFCVTGAALIAVIVWLATGVMQKLDDSAKSMATLKDLLVAEIHAHALRLTALEEWRKALQYRRDV
jgi:cytochrome oxidase assembly protein ShyY1